MLVWTSPVELTSTIAGAADDQLTRLLTSIVFPFPPVPVATSCCWLPAGNAGFTGVTTMESSEPVPDRLTVCGLVLASSVTVSIPALVPSEVGVKLAEILQLAPAARVFGDGGQFENSAKSPETAIPEMVSGTV